VLRGFSLQFLFLPPATFFNFVVVLFKYNPFNFFQHLEDTCLHIYGAIMEERQIIKVAKALSDVTRFRLLQVIADSGEISCGRLADRLGITHATVSHHLKVLSESRLIDLSRKGQFSYAQITLNTLDEYYRALNLTLGTTPVEQSEKIIAS
jgi:ArsR family transcriptional regulator, arsenate/arsenite/antimonite-responsive transcriptional repressor